ncbi:unnamed protein product [Pipistrellus nathusii]|uniref:Uncharacterized protein n=1 Tax=Pipistrellus nathusii TaxID=59473 RepID=A0ABP0AG56_PIPNA
MPHFLMFSAAKVMVRYFTFVRVNASFPMNAAVNPNRNAHAQRDFPVVQTLAGQVSAALAWFHGKSAQQLHPAEAVALPTSLLSNFWGHALVGFAGFVLLILQLNSFQANKKGQMGIFRYCNNLFLE